MFYAHPHAKADHTHVVFFQLRSNGILCKSSMHPSSHKPEETPRRHRPPLSSFLPGEDTEDTRRRHIQEHRNLKIPEGATGRHYLSCLCCHWVPGCVTVSAPGETGPGRHYNFCIDRPGSCDCCCCFCVVATALSVPVRPFFCPSSMSANRDCRRRSIYPKGCRCRRIPTPSRAKSCIALSPCSSSWCAPPSAQGRGLKTAQASTLD